MTLPTLPTSSESLSYSDLLTHFGNTNLVPHNLSDYYGAEDEDWTDPDTSTDSTGRIIVLHQPLNTSFTSDYQLNTITITGEQTYTFNSNNESWEYKNWNGSSDTATSVATAYSYSDTWTGTILNSTTNINWNRASGYTPSGSTGITNLGSYYIYTESSSGSKKVFGARSPEITIAVGSQELVIQAGSYGSGIGPVYYYWMPTGVTSGNLTDKVLMYTDAANSTTSIQNLSGDWTAPSGGSSGGGNGNGNGGGGGTSTGRLVVFYRPRWTSTSYRGDYQLDQITITDEVSYTFNSSAESWQRKSWNSSVTNYSGLANTYSNSDTWSSISTASTTTRFNRRQGGTPSSSTGVSNLGSYYIYAETSGTLQGFYGARSPEITIASGSQELFIRFASYGSNCGPCYYYWMPTNDSDKTLIYAQSQINTTSIQNTTVSWTAP